MAQWCKRCKAEVTVRVYKVSAMEVREAIWVEGDGTRSPVNEPRGRTWVEWDETVFCGRCCRRIPHLQANRDTGAIEEVG